MALIYDDVKRWLADMAKANFYRIAIAKFIIERNM